MGFRHVTCALRAQRLLFRSLVPLLLLCVLAGSISTTVRGDERKTEKGLDTSQFESFEGFFNFYWDDKKGQVWLDVTEPAPANQGSFLYVNSLATGLGSNPVGLDRGQLGDTRIVHFRRVGEKVFLAQENWKFRASTDNQLEKRAIRDSFADSIIWSGDIKEAQDGTLLVELSSLLLRDAHRGVQALDAAGQGKYSFAKDRSFIHLPRCKSFPKNTEFEAAITLTANEPGRLARRTAADGRSVTLRQHHSFIKLPDANYKSRPWDPRVGCFSVGFSDYGVPIDRAVEHRLISRHRLEKVDPQSSSSRAKEPIIYYVDPGVPEPVLSALIEGASWWNEAFESAGFVDAFQVKVLPEDADPMDVRYNVIQWVHRATRGWSYGQTITDPRTGEILKGHVLLGSLRVRQDHLLFQGLQSPFGSNRRQPTGRSLV